MSDILDILTKDVKTIKKHIESLPMNQYQNYISRLMTSDKKSLQNLALSMSKKLDKYEDEKKRIEKLYEYEKNIRESENKKNILCIDEVGRGPLAGPLVVCGVMLDENPEILYVDDSKKLSEKKRKEIFDEIMKKNIRYEIMTVEVDKIDELNIFNATYGAMSQIAKNFPIKADHILVDGNQILKDVNIDQTAVIKGDSKVLGIAIASIIAKVTRDQMMIDYDKIYPMYDFASNKGYGTSKHIEGIKKYGTCPIHRMSFLKNIL
ncbi:ribonuclease HII [Peptostreptococcaceae bacterium AS15]|nr:ribonuclease HII [Peptostreptococcaceae bacterium AS15]